MPRRKKKGICVYCGAEGNVTDDHVPPENLFPKKLRSQLIKGPACDTCNGGASKDDEYFRLAIQTRLDVDEHPSIDEITSKVHRSLEYPEAPGLRKLFLKSVVQCDVYSQGGIYLGTAPGFHANLLRMNLVATMVVKGLHYQEHAQRRPGPCIAAAWDE